MNIPVSILGGAATCSECFVICFLKVPPAYLGSMAAAVKAAAVKPVELRNLWNSQKTVNNPVCRLYAGTLASNDANDSKYWKQD